jgi:hypothetical protein
MYNNDFEGDASLLTGCAAEGLMIMMGIFIQWHSSICKPPAIKRVGVSEMA